MKALAMMMCLVCGLSASASVIHTIDFESINAGYTSSTNWNPSDGDYFDRAENETFAGMVPFSNTTGWFWAAEDTDILGEQYVTSSLIDVTGYDSFSVSISVANDSSSANFDQTDYLDLEYSMNGTSFTLFGSFHGGTAMVPGNAGRFSVDANFDGYGDDVDAVDAVFSDFSFAIPSEMTGSDLYVRAAVHVKGSSEIGFDNIIVTAEAIPEPATMGLITLFGGAILLLRRFS